MQDTYVGDIGDFGKFVLLRRLEKEGFKIGINWYKTDLPGALKDGDYEIPCLFDNSEEGEIAKQLRGLFDAKSPPLRSIEALENLKLIGSNCYYHAAVPQTGVDRKHWYEESKKKFQDCNLVFLDPDNGLQVNSVKENSKKSVKYVYTREIMDYLKNENCKCVMFYNHRSRIKPDQYFLEKQRRLEEGMNSDHYLVAHITFPRQTIRDYFAVCKDKEAHAIIRAAFDKILESQWASKEYRLCRKQ